MNKKLMPNVFLWMVVGLIVTFITGFIVSINKNMLQTVFSRGGYIIFAIVEFALVIFLSARIKKMSPTTCRVVFLLYSFISGITFSAIFIYYKMASIMYVFLIAAVLFGIFSIIGYKTKLDLTKIGTYFIMAIFGIIIVSIINIFVGSSTLSMILSAVIIVLFMGVTAYDIQKIKSNLRGIPEENLPVYGAFELYLDYINIFIHLLSLFGRDN